MGIMDRKIGNLIWVLVGLVAIVAALAIAGSYFFGVGYPSGTGAYGMMGGYGYYSMGIIMPILGAISVVFVILFIYFILDAFRDEDIRHYEPRAMTPEDIAKERLARGEITEEQYRKIIETIR